MKNLDPDALVEAKKIRQWQIKLLRACNCTYPIDTVRNGTGHDETCPAHVLEILERKRR